MRLPLIPPRTPIESREPIDDFAIIRALTTAAALAALLILGLPYGGAATAVVGAVALPWALAVLVLTRRSVDAGLSPWIALGDMIVLGALQAVEHETYVPVHFAALFFVAAHAHFQGAGWGLIVGALAPAVIIPVTLATDMPLAESRLHANEVVFATTCLATAFVVGSLREAESSARLRARALSRRTMDTESSVRRRLAQAIHDGPIQELSSVELMLAAAERAIGSDDPKAALAPLREARSLTRTNVGRLRDEIVDLGPYAFEELSYEQAVADCIENWERRYGVTVKTDIDTSMLPPMIAGTMFRITQEAVTNAGKHAKANTIIVRLDCPDGRAVLEILDDGRGFGHVDPLGPAEPGHIGLASIRERAEMLGGELTIDSGERGTALRVDLPL